MGGHQSRSRAARDMVPASGDAVPGLQTQSHAPEEASRQMTVYSEEKP